MVTSEEGRSCSWKAMLGYESRDTELCLSDFLKRLLSHRWKPYRERTACSLVLSVWRLHDACCFPCLVFFHPNVLADSSKVNKVWTAYRYPWAWRWKWLGLYFQQNIAAVWCYRRFNLKCSLWLIREKISLNFGQGAANSVSFLNTSRSPGASLVSSENTSYFRPLILACQCHLALGVSVCLGPSALLRSAYAFYCYC